MTACMLVYIYLCIYVCPRLSVSMFVCLPACLSEASMCVTDEQADRHIWMDARHIRQTDRQTDQQTASESTSQTDSQTKL